MKSQNQDISASIGWTCPIEMPGSGEGASPSIARGPVLSPRCHPARTAFTLVELIMVIVILAIGAAMAFPMLSMSSSVQVRAAADIVASDLEYAKSVAISEGRTHSLVFDASADSYQLQDDSSTILDHPVKVGFAYTVDFASDERLDETDLTNVSFDTTSTISFDYLGSPYNGNDNPLNSGSVDVSAGSVSATVSVEPVTGIISVND